MAALGIALRLNARAGRPDHEKATDAGRSNSIVFGSSQFDTASAENATLLISLPLDVASAAAETPC
jgi:hypothetical protein